MAATVIVYSLHGVAGATETQVDGTTFRYRRSDVDTNNASNPIPKPAAGSVWSWHKSFRMKITGTPDGDISNLRFFSDAGSWGTGVTLWAHTLPWANYAQGASGDETTKIVAGAGSAVTDASTYTSGSPLTVNAGTVISNPSIGYGTQDLVESQIEVASTASRGTKGPRVLTYRYDES